ncbi:hypothetical protein HMPREF1141_2451 [Clostridium sp. MSTE9]|nr:hypothetical protein HMPREF1141_2451 [Clostridium sp. MSTE9]
MSSIVFPPFIKNFVCFSVIQKGKNMRYAGLRRRGLNNRCCFMIQFSVNLNDSQSGNDAVCQG